jgi:hypothetical protein
MANVRYKLTSDVYMPLDGQWGVVGVGTVFDDLPTVTYAAGHVVVLSPSEPANQLGPHNRATSVRNVVRR